MQLPAKTVTGGTLYQERSIKDVYNKCVEIEG
jgi:hypothetical protein